jgi:hypothetical protein
VAGAVDLRAELSARARDLPTISPPRAALFPFRFKHEALTLRGSPTYTRPWRDPPGPSTRASTSRANLHGGIGAMARATGICGSCGGPRGRAMSVGCLSNCLRSLPALLFEPRSCASRAVLRGLTYTYDAHFYARLFYLHESIMVVIDHHRGGASDISWTICAA